MPKVSYIGEWPEGRESFTQHGVEFSQDGKAVEVKDKDALSRFEGNRFFVVDKETEANKAAVDEAEKNEAESLKSWLDERKVPYRANASVENLRKARADYEKAQADAQKGE